MRSEYDFLLAGGTGQIGRVLAPMLAERGRLFLVNRSTRDLPPARHVINCAGYTKFDSRIDRYWHDNVRLAVRLATHAKDCGAHYHQLSSEAVAEYRTSVLPETVIGPVAHPRMIDYALSKVLTEAAVRSIVPEARLSVYRCSDVVPPYGHIQTQWRPNHWLSILFSAGTAGFRDCDEFPVWIAPVDEVARAITLLVTSGQVGAFHLLGQVYIWQYFHSYAAIAPTPVGRTMALVDTVTKVVRIDPPLATCINQVRTKDLLKSMGFEWSRLPDPYWTAYSAMARRPHPHLNGGDHNGEVGNAATGVSSRDQAQDAGADSDVSRTTPGGHPKG